MIRILFIPVLRLSLRSRVLSMVTVMGLASATAIFLLPPSVTLDEFQYDKQHPDYEKVYRYVHNVNTDEGMRSYAFTSAATGPALVDRFPDVTDYTRMLFPIVSVQNPDKEESFNERKFAFADSN